jgi:signal transduction histidine kinase
VAERQRWQASVFRSANLAAVGQLAGSVAHQINNPLTVTMTNSQLLMLEFPPGSEIYQLAQGVFKAGQRIQQSVANLQDISSQEQYNFTETNLTDTLDDALALVSHSLRKAKVHITKDFQVQPILKASAGQLKLVWINLLLNALDAVATTTDPPQISISTATSVNNEVEVCIADNGLGFSPQQQKRLFQPFFSTKPTGHAVGLGLYAAQAIIERHGGRISVSSQVGEGAAFTVTLPLNPTQK